MSCVYFDDLRLHLREKFELICNFELNTFLYGSINLSEAENMLVFDAVHKFIMDSRHFEFLSFRFIHLPCLLLLFSLWLLQHMQAKYT